jgi:hypothetical protein
MMEIAVKAETRDHYVQPFETAAACASPRRTGSWVEDRRPLPTAIFDRAGRKFRRNPLKSLIWRKENEAEEPPLPAVWVTFPGKKRALSSKKHRFPSQNVFWPG